ncbi:MAG: hypothetical protein M1140_09755 [Chloroflexi bacterium]|nr:hypothetical protein [Chloroflexota bacterium]
MSLSRVHVRRWIVWLPGLLIFVLGLLVYGYALNLPYRIDDFVHFRLLSAHTLADVWLGNAGLAYYRPLPFTLWKLVYGLTGEYSPHLIPAINMVCHALNGVMVYNLVRLHQARTDAGTLTGLCAAILFLLFPFSYQAIPWVGSLTHPLVTLIMLSGIVIAVLAAERRFVWLWIASLALALIAPFAHETGVLFAAGLTLFYFTAPSHNASVSGRSGRGLPAAVRVAMNDLLQSARKAGPYWLIALASLVILLAIRQHDNAPAVKLDLESRLQNGVYFLQGLAYPVAPLATHLLSIFPKLNDLGAVLIVCVPAMLILVFVYVRLGQARLALFATGWYLVMIAPAWLALEFSYVVDGPRLMYEASLGAAIFWALPLAVLVNRWRGLSQTPKRLAGLAVVALTIAGTMVGSVIFLDQRADMYEQTRLASEGMISSAIAPSTDNRNVLSVNFPAWIAPITPTYALGHEGVSFVPAYSSPIDLVWAMTGVDHPMYNAVVTELQTHWRFNYLNYGSRWTSPDLQPQLRIAREVLFTSYRNHDLVTYDAGKLEAENTPRAPTYIAAYSGTLALLGGRWHRVPTGLQVTLHWQSWVTLTQEVRTYIHMTDTSDALVAQEDGLPLMGLSNPLWWKPGDQWADTRVLVLPETIKPGNYTLRVGVYPAAGGPRLPALDPAGLRFPDDSATLGTAAIP